jgi:hypothetical protein
MTAATNHFRIHQSDDLCGGARHRRGHAPCTTDEASRLLARPGTRGHHARPRRRRASAGGCNCGRRHVSCHHGAQIVQSHCPAARRWEHLLEHLPNVHTEPLHAGATDTLLPDLDATRSELSLSLSRYLAARLETPSTPTSPVDPSAYLQLTRATLGVTRAGARSCLHCKHAGQAWSGRRESNPRS